MKEICGENAHIVFITTPGQVCSVARGLVFNFSTFLSFIGMRLTTIRSSRLFFFYLFSSFLCVCMCVRVSVQLYMKMCERNRTFLGVCRLDFRMRFVDYRENWVVFAAGSLDKRLQRRCDHKYRCITDRYCVEEIYVSGLRNHSDVS